MMRLKSEQEFQQEIRRVEPKLPEARRLLKNIPGVIDVKIGIKETGGQATNEVAFHVYVDKKKNLQDLPSEQRIPPRILDVPTDVIPRENFVPETVLVGGGPCSGGTLGVIALATAANTKVPEGTPLILTNKHVAGTGDLVGEGSTCDCKCSTCCDYGRVVDAKITDQVDAAIATLNSGVRFSHEILTIGAIRGDGTAITGTPIVKHGKTTGFTRGVVTNHQFDQPPRSDGSDLRLQIRVAPVAPFTDMSEGGDSGSAYVNPDTNEIVGLHHSGAGTLSTGNHIGPVMNEMKIDFPVMGTAGAMPLVATGLPDDEPSFYQAWAALQEDLKRTEVGTYWLELARRHAPEVRHLIDHDRETQMAWHRTQGPSFVSHYIKSARQADYRVPREIGGMRVENVIISMAAALQRNASQELSTAITNHYLDVLQFVSHEDSAMKLCERARTLAKADLSRFQRGESKCQHSQAHSNN